MSDQDEIRRLARERLKKIQATLPKPESPKIREAKEDFYKFCALLEIIDKSGKRIKFDRLNPIQARFCANRTGRDLGLKARQQGLTTIELARDLWKFFCFDGARVTIVCQSVSDNGPAKQLSNILKIMMEGLRKEGWPLKFATDAWNEWVLENGNTLRIVVAGASEDAASKKGRSGTITRLHLTETAFYEYADISLNALLECVPGPETGSEITSESTANGAAGYYYQSCKDAQAGRGAYRFHFFTWYDDPTYQSKLEPGEVIVPENEREAKLVAKGVTPEQLKWRRAKIVDKGQDNFDQER